MRILITMGLQYEPIMGGASKTNRGVAEMLAHRGHSVQVVVPARDRSASRENPQDLLTSLSDRGIAWTEIAGGWSFELEGVRVAASDLSIPLPAFLVAQLENFKPDCIIVSSEDPFQQLLKEAVNYDPLRVIYYAHTPSCLPFGPCSFHKTRQGTKLLEQVSVVLTVSRFCADYIRQWSRLAPIQLYLPVYGDPPYPDLGRFQTGSVTLVNPCAYKGIEIFLELAKELPQTHFAAVPSWGTTDNDMERLRALANIDLLPPSSNIDDFLASTSVLLAPSVWLENFPMIITESMLRGIPVIASDVGGIPEVKLGTDYLIPVRQIESFKPEWNENKLWVPEMIGQDINSWARAVVELTTDQILYENASLNCKKAAEAFVSSLSYDPLEALLEEVSAQEAGENRSEARTRQGGASA